MLIFKSIGLTLIFTLITFVQLDNDVKIDCPKGKVCSLASDCPSTDSDEDSSDRCTLNGRLGLCCPVKDECIDVHPGSRSVFVVPKRDESGLYLSQSPVSKEMLESIKKEAQLKSDEITALIHRLSSDHEEKRRKRQAEIDGPLTETREEIYQRNLGIVRGISDWSDKDALLIEQATLLAAKKLGLKTPQQVATLKSIQIIDSDKCNNNLTCDQYAKYRPIDGSCNNLDNPYFGKVLTPYARVFLPQYDDSVSAPKFRGSSGKELPLARLVSNTLFKDKPMTHHNMDTLALAYGQFLDHDLTQVVGSTLPDNQPITCCDSSNKVLDAKDLHTQCFPLIIPETDPFYSQYNVTCLNFVRTAFDLPENCVLGPRTQINNLTPWVDASIVYGSDLKTSNRLRAFKGGLLDYQTVTSEQLLPPQNDTCNNGTLCLDGADSRVNQQPGLMATHITWLREHNRIAKALANLNPTWSDEELFQEARRIVIAEFQQVTYREFLPLIIGADLMKKYDLYPLESGFNEYYDPNLSPAIIQEFASAAFRLHTLIPGYIELRDNNLKVTRNTSLTKLYYNPSVFYEKPSVFQSIINGLFSQPVCPADNIVTDAITNHLFPPGTHGSDEPWGFDLMSIDVQRGRDHGLAGYNQWREVCNFKRAENFSDLTQYFYPESVPLVEQLYSSVDDIDLVVGLNLEPRPEGQNVGPTAACIITETFRRLKFSDRFWYENAGQPSSFTLSQLNSIRNVSYARIHCDNNGIEFTQEMAFLQPSDVNPRIPCSQLSSKSVDLTLWKKEALGTYGASLL